MRLEIVERCIAYMGSRHISNMVLVYCRSLKFGASLLILINASYRCDYMMSRGHGHNVTVTIDSVYSCRDSSSWRFSGDYNKSTYRDNCTKNFNKL